MRPRTAAVPAPASPRPADAAMRAYVALIVECGANVQPGQIVGIDAELGHEQLVRELAAHCYRRGALFVDVWYFDHHVKRARLRHAAADTLELVPPWYGARVRALGEHGAARILLRGTSHPEALADVDPIRAGRDMLPALPETGAVIAANTTNWTLVPCPSPGWAGLVYDDLAPEQAQARMWADLTKVCRLDEDDPAAAWLDRMRVLGRVADALSARRFSALRFRGPGTDLVVGLLPGSVFRTALGTTKDGIVHLANIPSEEVFSAPDPRRVDGVVRVTRPLVLAGSIISDIEIEFRGGVAVRVDASSSADVLRGHLARDPGASRLGEVALVDASGRVGRTGRIFYETLLDENAASHIAFGRAYQQCAEPADRGRLNASAIHVDVMIGSSEVMVTGIDRGVEHPVLIDGRWRL